MAVPTLGATCPRVSSIFLETNSRAKVRVPTERAVSAISGTRATGSPPLQQTLTLLNRVFSISFTFTVVILKNTPAIICAHYAPTAREDGRFEEFRRQRGASDWLRWSGEVVNILLIIGPKMVIFVEITLCFQSLLWKNPSLDDVFKWNI